MAKAMKSFRVWSAIAAVVVPFVRADVYLHNPRGSNNRLNERSANRNNGNRMFDSQNNNRGGYNKGDIDDNAAGDDENKQYNFKYFQSEEGVTGAKTELSIEWTNQHGCGGNEHGDPHKLNCNIVLQYMCHKDTGVNYERSNGPVDGTRRHCDKECMVPVPGNPDCDYPTIAGQISTGPAAAGADADAAAATPATVTKPACVLTEIDDEQLCLGMDYKWADGSTGGYKWVAAQVNDAYNCPHVCSTGQHSQTACVAAGGTWDNGYGPYRRMRDGTTTNRQQFTNPANGALNEAARHARKNGDVEEEEGYHESWEWYDECYRRERNRGLFTADQKLQNNALGYSSAVYTRQNPNNNRRGYECPEERDHYPYWHPTPWQDIAILTDRLDQCDHFQQESQNVKGKYLCRNTATCSNCIRYESASRCKANGGRWVQQGSWNIAPPSCVQAPWSRVNHLGNGRFGQANTYNFSIPNLGPSPLHDGKCVIRLRYNISTDDYDPWVVNASFNNDNGNNIESPILQNPAVSVSNEIALRLAINTAQLGRTFQDRSHVVDFIQRPSKTRRERDVEAVAAAETVGEGTKQKQKRSAMDLRLSNRPKRAAHAAEMFAGRKIYNLNVRGKRCNIVQCFPSVEYDFAPNHLHISENDLVHIQWTGSNTHNNGNPAGDGQAGDAGEGTRGTDRHNLVEIRSGVPGNFGESFPAPWEENTLFKQALEEVYAVDPALRQHLEGKSIEEQRRAVGVFSASTGYYLDYDTENSEYVNNARFDAQGTELNVLLNNAPATFLGFVGRWKRGTYNGMCTRNHNFSNRDQKFHLKVSAAP